VFLECVVVEVLESQQLDVALAADASCWQFEANQAAEKREILLELSFVVFKLLRSPENVLRLKSRRNSRFLFLDRLAAARANAIHDLSGFQHMEAPFFSHCRIAKMFLK
jgi:hypothetical protein